MRDLLVEVLNAKKISKKWNREKLFEMAKRFKNASKDNSIMWSYESGKEVCGFLINGQLVAYVHEKLSICFCLNEFDKYRNIYSDLLWFVKTEDFYRDEWFVDLKKMQETVPELPWRASIEAVNPESFSIDEFKFATQ
jgi:hypothetical protein